MIVGLIHISDIHLEANNNSILSKQDKLFDSIKNKIKDVKGCIIVISGDIAFSGKRDQYFVAEKFIDNLVNRIKEYTGIETNVVIVPGNHDCYFDKENENLRHLALENFRKNGFTNIDQKTLDICLEPQYEYFNFARKYTDLNYTTGLDKIFHSLEVEIHGKKIILNLYNTSWFSKLHEDPGVMLFPIDHFSELWENKNSALTLSILHHPLNWLTPDNGREFRKHLNKTSDIILSGHEHSPSSELISNYSGNNTYKIEAKALQDSKKRHVSGFNILLIDLEEKKMNVQIYDWNDGDYNVEEDSGWNLFKRGVLQKSKKFNIKEEYRDYLNNPGASFSHPNTNNLKLDDIFVFPTLRTIDIESKTEKPISSKNLVYRGLPIKALIIGDDGSGRTVLLKKLYSKYYDNGFIPIKLNVKDLNKITIDSLKKSINENFEDQYAENSNKLWKEDLSRVVMLIDDFHLFASNSKYKKTLLRNLVNICPNIVISGNKLVQFEEYTSSNSENIYEIFEQYQLLEYGPKLRWEIINKWNTLEEDSLEGNELLRKNDNAIKVTDDIIGKNLIPAYPIYILTILQSIESFVGQNPEFSLHGYYYQLIINQSVGNAVKNKQEIGAFHSCISNYCYFLFKENIRLRPIQKNDFINFYNDFADRYDITTISYDKMLKGLEDSKLIKLQEDQIYITYKYVYYYYVAKYLSDHISNPDIIKKIKSMCQRVYREEYSNILIFLIHLDKSQLILDELLTNSRQLFKEYDIAKLDGDVKFFNELVQKIPDEILAHPNVEDARDQELKDKEEYEQVEKEYENDELQKDYRLDEDISNLDVISRLNRGVKTIQILGQITKKHWAEIEAPKKYELAEETYFVGLRMLKFYFNLLENNIEVLIDHVRKIVLKKGNVKHLDKRKIKDITDEFIFNLCSLASYGIIKRISDSIGMQELSKTFDRILNNNRHKSVALTNMSIKLDHFSGFPEKDILDFNKDNKTNYLCVTVLRKFVIDYLHLYYTDYKQKQLICDELGIKISDQLLIQLTSKTRKDN